MEWDRDLRLLTSDKPRPHQTEWKKCDYISEVKNRLEKSGYTKGTLGRVSVKPRMGTKVPGATAGVRGPG